MTDRTSQIKRIMTIRNGMISDEDAEALVRREIERTSPETGLIEREVSVWFHALSRDSNGRASANLQDLSSLIKLIRAARSGHAPTPGVSAIAEERQRQISKEGWTTEHDDAHGDSELALAALCYLGAGIYDASDLPKLYWPWDFSWWKPADNRRNFVRAGALIAAEIDRIDRASPDTSTIRTSK